MKIFLITGFLGSGKTTLIRRLMQFNSAKKIAIIENDFGHMSLDASILESERRNGLRIKEIAGGSILCTCKSELFIHGLEEMIAYEPDVLIIEASGITNPQGIKKILKDNNLDVLLNLITIITTVNAVKFALQKKIFPAVTHQVEVADLVLLNHIDLMNQSEVNQLYVQLRGLNAQAPIIKTTFAEIGPEMINTLKFGSELSDIADLQLPDDRPEVFIVPQLDISLEHLLSFLERQLLFALRIKGYYTYQNETYLIQDDGKNLVTVNINYKPPKSGIELIVPKHHLSLLKKEYTGFRKSMKKVS